MIYLAVIAALAIGALVYEKKQNSLDKKEWALERGALLTRIQAPEAASFVVGENGDSEQMQYVPFEDDEAFNEAMDHLKDVGYEEGPE